jgi:quercetin dioxygenase-like cupin family protein
MTATRTESDTFGPIEVAQNVYWGAQSQRSAQTAAPAAASPGTAVPAAGLNRPGFDSKPILTSPISGDDQKEIVVITMTIAPGSSSPPHTDRKSVV